MSIQASSTKVHAARQFITAAIVPQEPTKTRDAAPGALGGSGALVFDAAKNQAAVVGSDVVSFVQGVTSERREAIVHSSLLAQLVAKKNVGDPTNIMAWYEQYFDVLSNVGWVIQQKEFAEYVENSDQFDAHKAILAVATTLLGPAAGALAIVTTTLNALHSMNESTPWITLWSRESQVAQVARFQIGLAQQSPEGDLMVNLMAFSLEAKTKITQILFFKATKNEAKLRHASGRVTLDTAVVDGVSADLKQKLIAHTKNYVQQLPDLAT